MGFTRVIYKYTFEETLLTIPLGRHDHILMVANQRPTDILPSVWVDHEASELGHAAKRQLAIIGTGNQFDGATVERYIGSAMTSDGAFVWHVHLLTYAATSSGRTPERTDP